MAEKNKIEENMMEEGSKGDDAMMGRDAQLLMRI